MEFIFTHFLGTLVNFIVVLVCGILGTLIKKGVPKRFTDIIMSAMAICVIYIGIDGILGEAPKVVQGSLLNAGLFKVLVMILSMAIGTFIGELIDIDKQLNRFATFCGKLFSRATKKSGEGDGLTEGEDSVASRFAEGFVSCSLLFCVGAMAVSGAILDAQGDPSVLFAKSIIDGIVCFIMATTLGIGCAFSAFFVLIYQGVFNVVGLLLSNFVAPATISYMSFTGSLIIILIGTNVLGVTKVKTANMVPAMFVAIGVEALLRLVFGA